MCSMLVYVDGSSKAREAAALSICSDGSDGILSGVQLVPSTTYGGTSLALRGELQRYN